MTAPDPACEEADRAATEATSIGGSVSSEPQSGETIDDAQRPLAEAGEGEAEGFEEAERELVEHASHGDQHAARQAIEDAPLEESDDPHAADAAAADEERSIERADETRERARR